MVTRIRGTAAGMGAGMVAGRAGGMSVGSSVRRVIGVMARLSASAGVGVASMPAIGVRLGAGVPVIGVAATGVAIGDITTTIIMQPRIIVRMLAVQTLMPIVIGAAGEEVAIRFIGSLHEVVMMDRPLL